jgi:tetratricopeptide (TPR) repeat protein
MKAAADINSRDYAAATAAAKEAIGLQPRYAPAHIVSGDVLKAQHQSDAALGEYRLALRLDPENSVAPTRIAGVLRAQKKTTEAAKYVRAVIAKHPRRPGYHVSLGWMLREQPDKVGADAEFDKAVTLYRERLQEDPDNAAIHEGLGEALHAARRLEEAAAAYREAISLEPRRSGTHQALASVLYQRHQFEAAGAEYRTAVELDPKFVGHHLALGDFLLDEGEVDAAEREYRTGAKLDPASALPHLGIDLVLKRQKRFDEAIAEFRTAIRLDATTAEAYNGVGIVLDDQGQHDEAMVEYRKAVELDPGRRWMTRLRSTTRPSSSIPGLPTPTTG